MNFKNKFLTSFKENSGSFELLDVCTASQQLKYISAIHYLYFENMRLKLINRELCNNLPAQPSVNSVQISKESILGKHKRFLFKLLY